MANLIAILIIGVAVSVLLAIEAKQSNDLRLKPCSEYANTRVKDIPTRCLKEYVK